MSKLRRQSSLPQNRPRRTVLNHSPVGRYQRSIKPERLSRLDRYLICDRTKVLATWENDGHGWQVRSEHGFVPASRNPERLPPQGEFKLVELQMAQPPNPLRLEGLVVYQLANRWALRGLVRGDDAILQTVTGPAGLSREQKSAIRLHMGEHWMREIWGSARDVLDYLANADYRTPGVGHAQPTRYTARGTP